MILVINEAKDIAHAGFAASSSTCLCYSVLSETWNQLPNI